MILLDSHVFYWFVKARPEISKEARRLIEQADEVFVSALSILELQLKMDKARLPEIDLLEVAKRSNLSLLPFAAEDGSAVKLFPILRGHDPIDAALLSQARNNRLDFLTADRRLLALELPWIIDAGSGSAR